MALGLTRAKQPAVTPPGGPAGVPGSPVPRRLSRPRWLDPRIIGGILLVVAAVVIGAKVIGASRHTTEVWAATHDLAAGTVLTAADLTPAEVNLGAAGVRYIGASGLPDGRLLTEAVHQGELLPASALAEAPNGRIVAIGVAPEHLPPGVGHGSVIDLYLTRAGTASKPAATELVGSSLTVQQVGSPASGGLSGAVSNRYQISVLLDPATADQLVRALPTGEPIVVLLSGAHR